MYKVVALLTENRVLLRTGVTNARYIHHQHADPWLTHSYKINRHEQESAVPFKDSVYAAMRKERTAEVTSETERNGEKNAVEADETRRDEEEKRVERQRNNNEVEAKRDEGTSEENHLVEAAADSETKRNGENSENHVVERTDARKRESEEEKKREKHNEEVVANAASNKEERKESETSGEPRVTRRRSYKHRVCFSPERDLYKPTQQLDFTYVMKSLIDKTGEKRVFRSRTIKTTKIILCFFFVLGGPRKSKW